MVKILGLFILLTVPVFAETTPYLDFAWNESHQAYVIRVDHDDLENDTIEISKPDSAIKFPQELLLLHANGKVTTAFIGIDCGNGLLMLDSSASWSINEDEITLSLTGQYIGWKDLKIDKTFRIIESEPGYLNFVKNK